MAGAIPLVNSPAVATEERGSSRVIAGLETAIFVCVVAIALCAPLSIKASVNSFRAATLLFVVLLFTGKFKVVRQPLAVPLLVFLVLTAISSAFSVDPLLSWGRMRSVALLLLAIVAGQIIRSWKQVKIVVGALLTACLITVIYTGWQYTAGIGVQARGNQAALASLQHFGLAPGDCIRKVGDQAIRTPDELFARLRDVTSPVKLTLARETPNGLQSVVINPMPQPMLAALQRPGIELVRGHPPRAQGFYKHYFPFSEVLVFAGLLVWALAISSSDLRQRIALILCFLAISTAILLTLTRISLASLLLGAFIVAVIQAKRRWLLLAAFVVVCLAGIYWIQRHRVPAATDGTDPGTEYRLVIWRDSLKLIKAHPFLGVGLDSVAGDWKRWDLEAYRRFPLHSHFHSTPIQLAVECGLPALAVWIWLIVAYARFLVYLERSLPQPERFARGLTLGVLGGLIAFVVTGFLQYNFGDAEPMVIFWLTMGLVFALERLVRTVPSERIPAASGV